MQSLHIHNIRICQCNQCIYIINESVNYVQSAAINVRHELNNQHYLRHTMPVHSYTLCPKQRQAEQCFTNALRLTLPRSIPPFHDTVDLGNLIAWLVQYIIISATHLIFHHGISNLYQHLLFNDQMLNRETRYVVVFPQFVILTAQMCTSTSLSLCFSVLYPHDFYGLLPEHIKQTAAYSVFF